MAACVLLAFTTSFLPLLLTKAPVDSQDHLQCCSDWSHSPQASTKVEAVLMLHAEVITKRKRSGTRHLKASMSQRAALHQLPDNSATQGNDLPPTNAGMSNQEDAEPEEDSNFETYAKQVTDKDVRSTLKTASTMNGTSGFDNEKDHISKLPPELMERVADDVPAEDLLALRLTCRDIDTKVLRTFARVHFTDKVFLPADEKCMEAMLAISKHHVFAKTMKRFEFLIMVLRPEKDIPHMRKQTPEDPLTPRAWRVANRETWRKYRCLRERQIKRLHQMLWLPILCESLQNFGTVTDGLDLAFYAHGPLFTPPKACGLKALEHEVGGVNILETHQYYNPSAYANLLTVIAQARCPILGLRTRPAQRNLCTRSSAISSATTHDGGTVFSGLRRLSIVADPYDTREASKVAQLVRYLSLSSVLERLEIDVVKGLSISHTILTTLYFPALRFFMMTDPSIEAEDLIHFMSLHVATLQDVSITGISGLRSVLDWRNELIKSTRPDVRRIGVRYEAVQGDLMSYITLDFRADESYTYVY